MSWPRRKQIIVNGFNGSQIELLKVIINIFREANNPLNLWNKIIFYFHSMTAGPAQHYLLKMDDKLIDRNEYIIVERNDNSKMRIKFGEISYKEYSVSFEII
uniref:Phage protein n=1 Tax=Acrobeloides nanus TaxID=290746 RepID=A0A914DYI7_9BILA